MSGRAALLAGLAVLALAWGGPLPRLAEGSFLAHMAMHMAVVAVAAPLLALGLARRAGAAALPGWAPVAASVVELAAIWAWHAPALHTLARTQAWALAAEQATFLGAALAVWTTALAAPASGPGRAGAAMAGAGALLFTSMHMTLLGVLIALSPRAICLAQTPGGGLFGLDLLRDQEVGGLLMLGAGGAVYLAGGLALAARLLRREESPAC
ncbi:cytochrome c oxidase assembly protein [Albimonas sp. CAU 1670]|uniref:cytochrome c oxidase assembly protein n=1 Tax=Albimonas sp. CAU 1670 TaxID=3032599 RepID=UPI0023DA8AA4|nr:cytochrome c oxidase assembly protein [Albimonas sp. CAU 1670]MDF2235147.1 cytochrome c oxidase assembly protein [Albimonas sp. CAU 1670]